MTSTSATQPSGLARFLPGSRQLPTLTAGAILIAMFAFGGFRHEHFASASNVSNLLGDYSYVGIAAIGATLVILIGGIDLSCGAMVAFSTILTAKLVGQGVHPLAALAIAVVIGGLVGGAMGGLIHLFALPAFMVTLAGMFAIRASGYLIHNQSLSIKHPFYSWANMSAELSLMGFTLPLRSMIFLGVLAAGIVALARTPLGMNIFALGGHERSARTMGAPVASTRISVYAIAGACSALAGWVFTLYKQAGDPASAVGLELEVIASVVIGGTLLSGGVGSLMGTLIGVLILGIIRQLIDFEGNLNAAWSSVATGALLLVFIAAQRAMTRK